MAASRVCWSVGKLGWAKGCSVEGILGETQRGGLQEEWLSGREWEQQGQGGLQRGVLGTGGPRGGDSPLPFGFPRQLALCDPTVLVE